MQMYILLIILVIVIFALCTYAFSMKRRVDEAARIADKFMKMHGKLEALLVLNERRCSTCLTKTTCPYSLGNASRHWIACPMWTGGEANKVPTQE